MNVVIYQVSDGQKVGEYQVNVGGLNYEPSVEEYCKEAYRCLVDDGLADGKGYDEFRFIVTS